MLKWFEKLSIRPGADCRAAHPTPNHADHPMLLSRFLKPKLQSTTPEARKPTLQELDTTDPALAEIARQDTDPVRRRTALERLVDLDLLQTIASEDADPAIQAAAQNRYQALLAGRIAESPTLADRLERLRHNPDPALIEFLTHHAAEPELRRAALTLIEAENLLVDIAVRNSHPEVRLAALERVHDPNLLDQIARQSRSRDKRVYRRARERLDELVAIQARAAHLDQMCGEMERLHWDGEAGPTAARLLKLEQEWRDQDANAPQELRERYAQARARLQTERQASAARRSERLELIASLETLLERLSHETEPSPGLNASIQYATREAPAAWAYIGPTQDADSRRLETRFQQLVRDIHEQERILRRNLDRAARLRELLQQAETLLAQPSEVHDADLKALRRQWESLEHPEAKTLASELQSRFDGLLDKLRARLQKQLQHRDQEWQDLQELARQLEEAAENGELQQATQLQEQTRQRLRRNIGLSRAQMTAIEERLQSCAGRINELRDWRRWAANQAREQICATVEGLIDLSGADPADIAQRIQQARQTWKDLDHKEGAAPKGLWKRFNSACERAYAPCQAYFEERVRERQQNLEKKAALCEQLEQFETTTDWQQVDWREADRLHRRSQEQWYRLGPINRSDRRNLDRRFHQAMQRLDGRLQTEREREVQRREQLIQQVQALADGSDLRTAIEIAKRAQAEWHPTVQAPPRQEQALWKAFRAACDAVFARRQNEQQAADSERQANLDQKQALCADLETLAAGDQEQLAQAQARLHAIQREWDDIGPVPKTEQRAISQRFESAIEQFARHERSLRRMNAQETFHNLRERAGLCAKLEALLIKPVDDAGIAVIQQAWATLPIVPGPLLEPIQRRFATVCQALHDPEQAQVLRETLEQNLPRKQAWCVCMEIVAGVESPSEHAQLRMSYQVARLSASLAGGAAMKSDALYDVPQLQEQWFLNGALPETAAVALDERFLHALQIWQQREEG